MPDLSFAKDIKPLFREKDRGSMLAQFDLWSVDDARDSASAILEALRAGTMPCDGQWARRTMSTAWQTGSRPAWRTDGFDRS